MLSITRMNVLPPGGYPYIQPGTGMKFDGNTPFKAQVVQIRAHRLGNRLPRTTAEEVALDLIEYTCNRVPGACSEVGMTTAYSAATGIVTRSANSRKCSSCGGRRT